MALITADRVKESTRTTGTASLVLDGASIGYRAFETVCANNDTCYYCVVSQTGTEWEVGLGTFKTVNTLERTTVNASSNAGSLVNFSAGTKDVFLALTATQFNGLTLPSQTGNSGKFLTTDGTAASWANILGSVTYQGTWNASTNSPSLASGVGTKGFYYVVSADGSTNLDGVTTWKIGDWAIYNGTAWQKVDNTDAVASVNGQTGTVVLGYSDVGAPSTTGAGASGTWGINVSGTSANVTGTVAIANGGTGTSTGSITGTGALAFTAATSEGVTISASDHGSVVVDSGADVVINSGKGYYDDGGSLIALRGVVKAQSATVGNGRSTSSTNTVLGTQALDAFVTPNANYVTAIGYQSLKSATSGSHSTTVGNSALFTVTNPASCTVVGSAAVSHLTSATGVVAIGASAGQYQANGVTNLTGSNNSIYIGTRAYGYNNSDDNTIVIGCDTAGKGANTTIIGNSSTTQTWLGGGELRLPGSTSGYVGLKGAAAAGSTTYTLPAADGTNGQFLKTDGSGALSWGTVSTTVDLATQVTGTLPIANGGTGQTTAANAINALLPTQTSNSGKYLTTNGTAASWSTVSASPAGSSGEVQYNSSGSFAGASKIIIQSSGWLNIADAKNNSGIGNLSLNSLTSGSRNQAWGASALRNATSGYDNLAIGFSSLQNCTTGAENIAIGYSALWSTTSSGNTSVGYSSGVNDAGGNNTTIGYSAQLPYGGTGANCTVIGYNAQASASNISNEITLGNSSINKLRCQVTSITSLSDARDKTNITPMPSVLSFIASLNPVRFDWWMRDGAKIGEADYGFIAQELQQAQNSTGFDWAQLVSESNPDRLEASPGKLIPILVKAIQELAAKVAALEAR